MAPTFQIVVIRGFALRKIWLKWHGNLYIAVLQKMVKGAKSITRIELDCWIEFYKGLHRDQTHHGSKTGYGLQFSKRRAESIVGVKLVMQ